MSKITYKVELKKEALLKDIAFLFASILFPFIRLRKKRKKGVSNRLDVDFQKNETAFETVNDDRRVENLEAITSDSIGEKCRNPKCFNTKKGKSQYCSNKCKSAFWNSINRE